MDEVGGLAQITKRLNTSSALVPSLILSAIGVTLAVGGFLIAPDDLKAIVAGVGVIPLILSCIQIIWFSMFDRDRLQNETHVENKMLIARMPSALGDKDTIIHGDRHTKLIDNPMRGGTDDV